MRESLQTTSRKVAEELRLRREIVVGARRLGLAPPGPVGVLPGVSLGGAVLVPAPDVGSASVGAGGAAATDATASVPLRPGAAISTASAVAVLATEGAASGGGPSLTDVRAEYARWSVAHKRPKTILNDTARLADFFAVVPGKALGEIRTADVERFLTNKAASGKRPATQMWHREILHAFWRWALRQGYVETNIVTAIPRPKIPERDPVFLGLGQVDELLTAVAGTNIEVAVAVAVFAGLRREELCWLTWEDVEFDRAPAMLRVRAKTIAGESWQPKTRRDRRVPISPRLLAVLERHRDTGRRKAAPWLLPSPLGCRWDPDNLSADIRAVLKSAGLPWNLLHLRHTFGSQLARKGVSLLKIAKLMGNSPTIAARHYINLVPEEMGDEVAF